MLTLTARDIGVILLIITVVFAFMGIFLIKFAIDLDDFESRIKKLEKEGSQIGEIDKETDR